MESKYSIKIMPKALEDLDNIYSYILNESKEKSVAADIINKIEERIFMLEDFPESCPYSVFKGYRKLIIGKYIAFYAVSKKDKFVTIFRIIYGMMNYEKEL